jgi:hypothetical protein
MKLPGAAIGFGIALVILGAGAFAWTGAKTSLIPAYVGAVIGVCGAIALKGEYRKHAMHIAAAVGLLGFLAAAGRLVPALVKGTLPAAPALLSLSLMLLLTGVFVALCVRSFIVARRLRRGD